ncbi:O-antigen ligase [Mycobacterium sp. DL592]|uniref:O-antigen ligase family protein n=1 Tax=Mycobacterium sp. DL592 TaxID=2675524 RepID=UPI001422D3B6|nr:O-antigen ligase family protein [Mycobacterium sp. DL592]
MTTNHNLRTAPLPAPQTRSPWPLTTVLGSAIAFSLPFNQQLPSAPRALWFVCVAALIGIPILFAKAGRRPLYPAVWIVAGYAAIVAVLTATRDGTIPDNFFVGSQLLLLVGFGPFAMTANALTDPKFIQRVSVAFLGGQFLSDLAAILQLLGFTTVGSKPVWGRAYGLAEHPTTLGLLACVGILVAFEFLLNTRRHRTLVLIALAANFAGLIASGTLSAMMALALGATVVVVARRDRLGKIALRGIAFTLILWAIGTLTGIADYFPSAQHRYLEVTGQTKSDSSWEFRLSTIRFGWNRILEDPFFGVGLNIKYSETIERATVHNVFVRAWYQGGIVLAVAFALIVIAITAVALKAMVHKKNATEAGVLIAVFSYALTSSFFEQRHFWLPVIVAWGSISAAAIRNPSPKGTAPDLGAHPCRITASNSSSTDSKPVRRM